MMQATYMAASSVNLSREGIAIHCHSLLNCALDIKPHRDTHNKYSLHAISTYMLQLSPALQFQVCLNGTGGERQHQKNLVLRT